MRSYTLYFLMKHTTPFLPAFGSLLFGRRPKSEQAKALEKLKSTNTLGDLKAVCTDSIPDELLSPAAKGDLSRRRQYSLPVLFWELGVRVHFLSKLDCVWWGKQAFAES